MLDFLRKNRFSVAVIGVFIVALIVFSLFVFYIFPVNAVFTKYQVAAGQYIDGVMPRERLLDLSPLYLYLNIFAVKVFPVPHLFLLVVQVISVSLAALLLFLLLNRYFKFYMSLIGVLLFMTSKSVILYTCSLEPEPFSILFLLGVLYFSGGKEKGSIFIAGLSLGLSILTRSNFFPLLAVVPIYLIIRAMNSKESEEKRESEVSKHVEASSMGRVFGVKPVLGYIRKSFLVVFLVPVMIVLVFLVYRNTRLAGEFTIFSMNPGPVFYEGNNPNSWGESATYPPLVKEYADQFRNESDFEHVIYRYFARRVEGRALSVNEVNAYWKERALAFMKDHPRHYLERVMSKLNFVFHNHRRHDLEDVYSNDSRYMRRIPFLPFAIVSALALAGAVVSVRRWREFLVIYAAFFLQVAIMVVLYVSDRQRVVVVSVFIFFAVCFWDWVMMKPRKWVSVICVVLLGSALMVENSVMADENYQWQRFRVSNGMMVEAVKARKAGDLMTAAKKNALAGALLPSVMEKRRLGYLSFGGKTYKERVLEVSAQVGVEEPSAFFDLGIVLLENGKLKEAREVFQQLVKMGVRFNRQYSQSSLPEYYLGRIEMLGGDHLAARTFWETALRKNPGDPWVLAALYIETEADLYKESLLRYFGEIDGQFILGQGYWDVGRYREAVIAFEYVVKQLSGYRFGMIYLALAYGRAGEDGKAVEMIQRVLMIGEEPISFGEGLLEICKRYVGDHPEDGAARETMDKLSRLVPVN